MTSKVLTALGTAAFALAATSAAHAFTFPAFGADTGPGLIITVTPSGSLGGVTTAQGPYDKIEDTYIGIVNHSASTVFSVNLGTSGGSVSIPLQLSEAAAIEATITGGGRVRIQLLRRPAGSSAAVLVPPAGNKLRVRYSIVNRAATMRSDQRKKPVLCSASVNSSSTKCMPML